MYSTIMNRGNKNAYQRYKNRNGSKKMDNISGSIFLFGSLGSSINAEEIYFFELREKSKSSTKAQLKNLEKEYIGKQVRWEGWVVEVKDKLLGGYEVLIDMDPPKLLSVGVYDVSINLPPKSKDIALALPKHSKVSFAGFIKNINYNFGRLSVELVDVVFLPPKELDFEGQIKK